MGCLKLHTEQNYTGLKVVYGGLYESKKSIQRFLSVDPLADKFPWQTPYCAMDNDPISKTDPDGRAASKPDDWYAIKNKDGSTSMYQDKGNTEASHYNTYTKETYTNVGGDNLTAAQAEANANKLSTGTEWMNPLSKSLGVVDVLGTSSEFKGTLNTFDMYAQGIRKGVNGNYQLTGRNANLFRNAEMTAATAPISKLGKIGKVVGTGTLIVGTVADGIGVYNYYTKGADAPNTVHPVGAATNLSLGVWGMGIAKIGLRANPGAIFISAVEALYPGGWSGDDKNPGAAKVLYDIQKRDREMLGYYPKD